MERCTSFKSRVDGVCGYYISTEEELCVISNILSGDRGGIISLDLEGVYLSKRGVISLLQIFDGKAVYVFDVLLLKDKLFVEGGYLRNVLSSTSVTKIMFDCRKDCEALYHQYGVKLDNVIDVQMAEILYRYKIIRDAPKYFIGLASAVEQHNILKGSETFGCYTGIRNVALDKYSPARGGKMEVWSQRPVDVDLLLYCAEDIKNIYKLYTKVFSKKLSYETCIGVSMIRLREALKSVIDDSVDIAGCAITFPSPYGNSFVNFDVALFCKFEDSLQQYKKLGYIV